MQLKILGLQGATSIETVIAATAKMTATDTAAALAKTALTNEQKKSILISKGLKDQELEAAMATATHSTANVTATATTKGLTSATNNLSTAAKGLWAALKSNPLFWIVTAVTAVITVFNKLQEAADEAAERYEENFNKLTEASKAATDARVSVGSLIEQYKELADASNGAWSVEEANELKGIQEQITSLVGDQAGNLDLVNGKIDEEYQKLLSIYSLLSDDELAAAESAYNVSQERLEKGYKHPGVNYLWDTNGEDDDLAAWYIMRAYEQVINPVEGANGNKWFAQEFLGMDEKYNGYAGNLGQALEMIGSYEDGLDTLYEWRDK